VTWLWPEGKAAEATPCLVKFTAQKELDEGIVERGFARQD